MWKRIYWAALIVSLVPVVFFAYYSRSWLRSIGAPGAALEGFDYYSGLGWIALLVSSAGLLILANVVLWRTRRAWAVWTTLLYFAVFTLVWYFWLKPGARKFALANGIPTDLSALTPFIGVVFSIAAAAFAYFDQFLIIRLAARMHPQTKSTTEEFPLPQPAIEAEYGEKPPTD